MTNARCDRPALFTNMSISTHTHTHTHTHIQTDTLTHEQVPVHVMVHSGGKLIRALARSSVPVMNISK